MPLLRVASTFTTLKKSSASSRASLKPIWVRLMPWLQLFIDTERDHVPVIEDALLKYGAVCVTNQEHIPEGQEEQPVLEPNLGETPLWQYTRITGLFHTDTNTEQINLRLQQELPTSNLQWEQLEDKDWEREWIHSYHPIQCAPKLWICPSWLEPPDPEATNLLLDPGLAFGTGTHPTTFLCMQWLAKQSIEGKTIIDYGCGSGILAIAALLLGAKKAVGVDIDPQALTASKDNLKRNQLKSNQLQLFLAKNYTKPQPADIVVANILAGPLIKLAPTLIDQTKIGAKICLSGILKPQAEAVIAAYNNKIQFDPIEQKDEWVRISGIRQ